MQYLTGVMLSPRVPPGCVGTQSALVPCRRWGTEWLDGRRKDILPCFNLFRVSLHAEQAQYHGLQAVDTRRHSVTRSTETGRAGYSTSDNGVTIYYFITGYGYSTMLETTRTYVAKITNHSQVRDDLDQCGHSASKLWTSDATTSNNGGTTTVRYPMKLN